MKHSAILKVELENGDIFSKIEYLPFVPTVQMHIYRRKIKMVDWDGKIFIVHLENLEWLEPKEEHKRLLLAGWKLAYKNE